MAQSPPKSTPSAVAINGFALGTSRRVSVDFYKRLLDHLAITDHRALLATAAFTESVA
jgi:hypothetical protein